MTAPHHLHVFPTALGSMGIVWRGADDVIVGVHLPEADEDATARRARRRFPSATAAPPSPAVTAVMARIEALLQGAPDDLADVVVDLSGASDFERAVYDLTRAVAPGRTTTYGAIATELGGVGMAVAVGQALGRNPVPVIVPCHRVVGAGGAMTGFSANGGIDTKRRLLFIEGALPSEPLRLFDD